MASYAWIDSYSVGSLIGFVMNLYQETLYQYAYLIWGSSLIWMRYRKHFAVRGPEARLYMACFAAVLFPTGMFIYAWSSFSSVHWIVQMIGITVSFHSFLARTIGVLISGLRYFSGRHTLCTCLYFLTLLIGAYLILCKPCNSRRCCDPNKLRTLRFFCTRWTKSRSYVTFGFTDRKTPPLKPSDR